jgi:hypothetical protein
MRRPASIHQPVFVSLTLACIAASWWGCATAGEKPTTATSSSSSTGGGASSGSGGAGTTAGVGGIDVGDGGPGVDDGGACASTSAESQHIPLDILFLIDQSGSNAGPKWAGIASALKTFINDPASAGIGVGLSFFPNHYVATCDPVEFETPAVPIDVLPGHAFALTNSIPADAICWGTPTYAALKGTLLAATAYQDAHPTHKVIVVMATDGEPNSCGATTINQIAGFAKSARNYNGVLTYVLSVEGATVATLDKIAAAGGTTAAYDITNDINQFFTKIAEIRAVALGCDFEIPPPPHNQDLDPDKVNFSYTPKGLGTPKVLPRADDLADCNGKPGWYYDSNIAPTKIVLCPASCTTVEADSNAKVSVLFGCNSQVN